MACQGMNKMRKNFSCLTSALISLTVVVKDLKVLHSSGAETKDQGEIKEKRLRVREQTKALKGSSVDQYQSQVLQN